MNSFIETLNRSGGIFLNFAWSMFWQSGLLVVILFAFDLLFRRKLRASIHYALWLVVLVKLCVPPTLALPTSPAWWLHKTPLPAAVAHYTVTYDNGPLPEIPQSPPPVFVPPKPAMTFAAWLLLFSVAISSMLLVWLLMRWWQITRQVRRAKTSERLAALAEEAQKFAGMKFKVQVKLTTNSMSPAVCGLFRPAILIPQSLADNFSDEQLRAVLLHELIHLRRRDVWVNFVQALLQIFYWWHPLVWLANARIRRVREEAVDDAVMLALRDDAENYAPTLLEVAKLALNRPLASLGLVGILESRHALRQRIERLVDFRPPRKAGLTLVSIFGILAFTAVAVPMGGAPPSNDNTFSSDTNLSELKSLTVKVNPEIFIRNVKARAGQYLLSPTNDYTDVLLEIMRSEDVDCSPPHGIAFNTRTGEITTQNSPEQLGIFQQVIEQLNRTDGICELPLHNNFLRKTVLIEARLYQMSAADFKRIASGLQFYPNTPGGDSWWSSSPENFQQLIETMKSVGFKPIQRPRIQTGSGMPAEFYVGNATNSVDFECQPFANEGSIDLKIRVTIIDDILFTNRFNIQASAQNGGGIVIRTENFAGHGESNLVTIINMQIVTNQVRLVPVKKQLNSNLPQIHIKARFVEVPTNGFVDPAMLTNNGGGGVTGIINPENFKTFLKSLQTKFGVETLAEPEVTTASGRRTQMRATKEIKVISGVSFENNYHIPGISSNEGNAISFQEQPLETGPVLDTVPYVLSDDHTIFLNVTASLTEFFGYEKSTNSPAIVKTTEGDVPLPPVSPSVRIRKAIADVNLYDGQTLVLSKFNTEAVGAKNFPKHENRELLVFVTVTLVDPAGNRIHSDDEMPFAKNGIPAQPNH
jgi:beta-lactamase regulating signal transducer with metallopeptidase domain